MAIALTNLVTNAANFSPAQGQLRVLLGGDTEKLCLSVEDQGPGIAAAQARDPAYAAARAAGEVGEKMDGYLGYVVSPSAALAGASVRARCCIDSREEMICRLFLTR